MSSSPTSLFNSGYIFSPEFCTSESPEYSEIPPPPAPIPLVQENIVQENVEIEPTFLWSNHQDILFPSFENNGSRGINNCNNTLMVPFTNDNSTFFDVSTFPQQLGDVVDVMEPTSSSLPDYDIGCFNSTCVGVGVGQEYHQSLEEPIIHFEQPASFYDDELINKKYCEEFGSNYQAPLYYGDHNNNNNNVWEIQGNSIIQTNNGMEEQASTKVRRYTEEERKNRILKYLKKRNQRNFNKTIKYACRKTLADRRIRIRGRFAKNNEVGEEPEPTKKSNNHHDHDEYNYDDSQTKSEEEEWLQEAITNLMYLPIFA